VEVAGSAGGQGPVGREAGGWAWGEGGGPREEEGSGPVADHTGRVKKGGRGKIIARAEIQGSKRKINLIDFLD
jgi:hypothetical protein